jgi:hypothetical protein
MEKTIKQKIKIAAMIQEQLRLLQDHHFREVQRLIYVVGTHLDSLQTGRKCLEQCSYRNWHGAATKLTGRIENWLHDLPYAVEQALHMIGNARNQTPALRPIWDELEQLQQEFGRIECDLAEKSLSVFTDPIELEGMFLGDFEIRLEIEKLGQLRDSSIFRIIALDPHPAATNDSVTHPHVSEECLCAGDAGAALLQALATGRICDAFLLVKAVLETYNSSSPYVSLDEWEGISCYDCGYVVNSEEIYYCEGCDHEYCSDCFSYCRSCETSFCRSCLSECPVCEEPVCKSCLSACSECEESMCVSCLENGICVSCQEGKEADDEKETIEAEQHVA